MGHRGSKSAALPRPAIATTQSYNRAVWPRKIFPWNVPGNLLISHRDQTFDAFRRWGHLQAKLDPLGQYLLPEPVPELNFDGEDAEEAKGYYCGSIGVEFMHIPDPARREWIQERMEQAAPVPDQRHILERLTQADLFEQVIQSRYLGTKRFSLEGVTVLIPFLDEILNHAADYGAEKAVMGMSHRGRLNVMTNTIGKSAADIFSKFEDANPRSILGGGDVKYHVGATGYFVTRTGGRISLHLVSNPSHLEAVDPVAMGRARARQVRIGETGQAKVLPVAHSWRCGLCRPGHLGRNHEPRHHARLYRRRDAFRSSSTI